MLSIDEILQADDQQIRTVSCPEWGGDVFIRSMTADEADRLETLVHEEGVSQTAALVGLSLCDEDGKPMKATPAQMNGLGRKWAAPLRRIGQEVLDLNGWTNDAQEVAEKNSETTDANS